MPKQKRPKSLLRLKIKGPNIKPGRVPIPELLVICEEAQNAVNRQAEALIGKKSLRPGPSTSVVRTECTLELFAISKGSAYMSFAGPEPQPTRQGVLDLDMQQLGEAAVRDVVNSLRTAKRKAPTDMNVGVRRALERMGELLTNGVTSIEFVVPGTRAKGHPRIAATFDEQLWKRIDQRKATSSEQVSIDGLLEMADFKADDLRCIVHTPDNQRVPCSFSPELADDVHKALRRVTRVIGVATVNVRTRRTESIELSSVRILNPYLREADDFFATRSIQQLTEVQGTDPSFDLRSLEHAWPDDEDVDVFLSAIGEGRS